MPHATSYTLSILSPLPHYILCIASKAMLSVIRCHMNKPPYPTFNQVSSMTLLWQCIASYIIIVRGSKSNTAGA